METKKAAIYQDQILGQRLGTRRSLSKIAKEGKTVDKDREEKERKIR